MMIANVCILQYNVIRKEVNNMPNTAAVYARIDPQLKKDVEVILSQLNVSPSSLIQMLYGQIKLTKGIPFEIKLPQKEPLFLDEMTEEQLVEEVNKGIKDLEEGRVYTSEEVRTILKKELNLK